MGDFILLPSLLLTVISHQGTQSHWIPSSLRQFHCPLSVSVTQTPPPLYAVVLDAGWKKKVCSLPNSWTRFCRHSPLLCALKRKF